IADVGQVGMNAVAMALLQPIEVPLDAGPAQIVEHDHLVAVGQKAVGEIRADEAAAAGDQDGSLRAVHDTSPLSSSWRRISAPLSTAGAARTQSANSSSESSRRWRG